MAPLVTVVMPAYNGMPHLRQAVESILGQTLHDLKLVVHDDGSTDASLDYLRGVADPRLVVVSAAHRGLVGSLNDEIATLSTPYFARLDQDDVASPRRLESQVGYLEEHPETGGVLCQVARIGRDGRVFGVYRQAAGRYDPIRHGMIVHSALCARSQILADLRGYREAFYPADDFDLSCRMAEASSLELLPDTLVHYRVHAGASTFGTAMAMELGVRWAIDSAQRRRTGRLELSEDEFKQSFSLTLVARRRLAGKIAFRRAGSMMGEGRRVAATGWLGLAATLYPSFTARRLRALAAS